MVVEGPVQLQHEMADADPATLSGAVARETFGKQRRGAQLLLYVSLTWHVNSVVFFIAALKLLSGIVTPRAIDRPVFGPA